MTAYLPMVCVAQILSHSDRVGLLNAVISSLTNRDLYSELMTTSCNLERLLITRFGDLRLAMIRLVDMDQKRIMGILLLSRSDIPTVDFEQVLLYACRIGRTDMVRLLVESNLNGPRADCQDGEALMIACENGFDQIVRTLLNAPNAPRADCRDGRGMVHACVRGHASVLRILLASPTAPNINCVGGWCLIVACRQELSDVENDTLYVLMEAMVAKTQADEAGIDVVPGTVPIGWE